MAGLQGFLMAWGWALGPASSQPLGEERGTQTRPELPATALLKTTHLPPGLQMSVLIPMLTCDLGLSQWLMSGPRIQSPAAPSLVVCGSQAGLSEGRLEVGTEQTWPGHALGGMWGRAVNMHTNNNSAFRL